MLPREWRTVRKGRRNAFAFLVAALAAAPLPAAAEPVAAVAAVAAKDQRLTVSSQSTRFVIGLERSTEFQVFSLSNPNRVIVELPDVKMQLPLIPGDQPVGLVRSFRGGQSAPGQSRVVIDVTSPVVVDKAVMERAPDGKGHRLIIDIAPVSGLLKQTAAKSLARPVAAPATAPSGLGAAGVQPPLPRAAVRPEINAAKTYKPVIVLDPGHGGHDGGAKKHGVLEKDVVLAFSLMLRDKLQASGRYKVLMTRDNDSFVELDERREFAERHKAALFIAIHADYATATARGATIYSLRESVAESLKRSAKGTVRERVISGRELHAIKADAVGDASIVKGILADLAQREVEANRDRTSLFAQSVIEFMGQSTNMKDNPDRSAAFAVLKTAQVPAVLIELAYVSNQQDAANLVSNTWRQKVSDSIMTAIDNYFSHHSVRVPM